MFRRKIFLYAGRYFLPLLPAFFLLASAFFAGRQEAQAAGRELSDAVLRFHVLANSNSDEDQQAKYLVRDAVLKTLEPLLSEAASKQEAMNILMEQEPLIRETAQEVLTAQGLEQSVTVSLENCYFPAKTYGELCFPPGNYDALRIQLGEAKGRNWWCLMFPALCFTDLSGGILPASSDEKLRDSLTEETYESLRPTEFRFRLFPFLNGLF